MIGMTVLEPVVRLDAITEPGGKRRNDPLDRPELSSPNCDLYFTFWLLTVRRLRDSVSREDEDRPANAQTLLRTVSGLSVNAS